MRPEKEGIVGEVKARLGASGYAFYTDFQGLTVEQFGELRNRLAKVDGRCMVVKNAFLNIAAEQLGWERLGDVQKGPVAVVTGKGDLTEVVKALMGFRREFQRPAIKGGTLQGRFVSGADTEALAKIPSRGVLLAVLVGTIAAPMTHLAGVLRQKLASLVYLLKAYEEKRASGQ
jgi:large subunit ribosomal protein L10